jgi:cell shape-determining protein MreC
MSLLPPGALGWTRAPREVFKIILNPFAVVGNGLAERLRPPSSDQASDQMQVEQLEYLQEKLAELDRLYLAECDKVANLQRQLEQLQKLPPDSMKAAMKAITARIGMRSPSSPVGTVVLSRGKNHGVRPGTIAIYDGDDLIGRVSDDISAVHCTLVPLTNPATPLLDARVFSKDHASLAIANAPAIQLTSRGDGALHGQVDRLKVINAGDEVRLFDDRWPQTARAMVIGIVESVEPDQREPLRNSVVVKPRFQVSQLPDVVLKIELDETVNADPASATAETSR